MKRDLATLKTYFEFKDCPTEAQFADMLDSFIHKDEGISIENVQGLTGVLQNKASFIELGQLALIVRPWKVELDGDGYYDLPPNLQAWKISVRSIVDSDMIIETEEGAEDVRASDPDNLFLANKRKNVTCDISAEAPDVKRIFFRNVPGYTNILIYRLSLSPIN